MQGDRGERRQSFPAQDHTARKELPSVPFYIFFEPIVAIYSVFLYRLEVKFRKVFVGYDKNRVDKSNEMRYDK